jgi:hypothetical protein
MSTTVPFHERPEFLLGRNGEQVVVAWLTQRGWFVIPSYDYSGSERDKAPKLQGLLERFVIPDLDACRGGVRRWIEVKTKSDATLGRLSKQPEHGIEHYDEYVRVAAETGTEAWLAILELSTRQLLAQSFEKLGKPRQSTSRNGKPMAFWVRSRFIHLHTFGPELVGFDGP